jgi:hypothetical protein
MSEEQQSMTMPEVWEQVHLAKDEFIRIGLLFTTLSNDYDRMVTKLRHTQGNLNAANMDVARLQSELKLREEQLEQLRIRDEVYQDEEKNGEVSRRIHQSKVDKKNKHKLEAVRTEEQVEEFSPPQI